MRWFFYFCRTHLWSSKSRYLITATQSRVPTYEGIRQGRIMKSNYTFKHLDYSESLVSYTNTKLDEIGQFLLRDGRCNVYYFKNQYEFVVEVSLNTKEKFFKATASASDIYVAVDLMTDKLEKQFLTTEAR